MKIIAADKYYYFRGGAERYMLELDRRLEKAGDTVVTFAMRDPRNRPSQYAEYFVSPVETGRIRFDLEGLRTAGRMLYSFEAAGKFAALVDKTRPDVLHVHNIYHQISPSILAAARRRRLPAVMTLHDYHLVSPNYLMYARGKPLRVSGRHPFFDTLRRRAVLDSYVASALSAFEGWLHERLGLYDSVYRFIAPSRFIREICLEYGVPKEKIEHIPHFVETAGVKVAPLLETAKILFVGRLSEEKGAHVLIEAMRELPGVRCVIVGEGPERPRLEAMIREFGLKNVTLAGAKYGADLEKEYAGARAVVIPSVCFEVFGLTALEAYAAGRPVVASNLGGLPEVVRDTVTGLLFEPGNAKDLADKLGLLVSSPALAQQMGTAGRALAEKEYAPGPHVDKIRDLYRRAIND